MHLLYIILLLNIYSSKTNLLGEKAIICFIKRLFPPWNIYLGVPHSFAKSLAWDYGIPTFSEQSREDKLTGKPWTLCARSERSKHSDRPLSRPLFQSTISFYINEIHSLFKVLQGIYLSVGGIKKHRDQKEATEERVSFWISGPEWDFIVVRRALEQGLEQEAVWSCFHPQIGSNTKTRERAKLYTLKARPQHHTSSIKATLPKGSITFLNWRHQLGTKYSDTWAYEGYFSNHSMHHAWICSGNKLEHVCPREEHRPVCGCPLVHIRNTWKCFQPVFFGQHY